jgi:hypothetical protein
MSREVPARWREIALANPKHSIHQETFTAASKASTATDCLRSFSEKVEETE